MKLKKRYSYGEIIIFNIVILLIVPLVVILIVFSGHLIVKNKEDYLISSGLVIHEVKKTREQHTQNILKIANNISNNKSLWGFFISPYTNKNLSYYMNTIRNIVLSKVADEDRYKVKIYYANETIPRGMEIFYKIKDINHIDSMKDFLESEAKERWLTPRQTLAIEPSIYHTLNNNYTYLRKVLIDNKLVYLIAISVEEPVMNSFLYEYQEIDRINQIIRDEGYILVNQSHKDIGPIESLEDTLNEFRKKRYHVNEFAFDYLNEKIIYIRDKNYGSDQLIRVVLLSLIITSIVVCYILILIRKVFKQIFLCIETLKYSLENELYIELEESNQEKKEIYDIKIAFNSLINKICSLIKIAEEQSIISKESQFKALQHQINPHFMYNTLEVFSYRMELYKHFDEADAIASFSQMLRYNISNKNKYATVREEIQQVQKYISIQKLKYEVEFKLAIDEEVYSYRLIKFILQPIVENCFAHGYEGEMLEIDMELQVNEQFMRCVIRDNGKGMEQGNLKVLNEVLKKGDQDDENHIGLRNISKRLKLFYGENYRFAIENGVENGICVILELPILKIE